MINILCTKKSKYNIWFANDVGISGCHVKTLWRYVQVAILRTGICQKIMRKISLNLTVKFLKYCIVGTITTLEGWTIVFCLTEFIGTHYIISSMIGTPIVLVSAFALNNLWTWGKDDNREVIWLKRLLQSLKIGQ